MDHASALATLNAKVLKAYSARTVAGLRARLPLQVALPYLEPVLALNVENEARKDRMTIGYAAAAAARGAAPPREIANEILEASRAIDAGFLQSAEQFPIRVRIRYEEIEPLRLSRIRYVLDTAYRILSAWQERMRFRAALRKCYPQSDFELVMNVIMDLYARETRALSHSLDLPKVLMPVSERAVKYLSSIMADAGTRLVRELAVEAYRI